MTAVAGIHGIDNVLGAPFSLGFWHPFGPHGDERPQDIVVRKLREIETNGWTLWSFQHRQMLGAWMHQIRSVRPAAVAVFCSRGRENENQPVHAAHVKPVPCRSYRFVEDAAWRELPSAISVPHPFPAHVNEASAFVVQRLILVAWWEPQIDATLQWLHRDGTWRRDKVPSRGEYLIRPGRGKPLRPYCAVLVLREPYLALVRAA